jgi:hypothetical protein
MDAVVTSFGSHGDFNPLLAIARALVGRGVAVTFVANPFYAREVILLDAERLGRAPRALTTTSDHRPELPAVPASESSSPVLRHRSGSLLLARIASRLKRKAN